MKITIACVGKIKEKYLTAGIEEFSKRLTPFCKLETLSINEERMPENPSAAEKEQVLERETQRLLAIIPRINTNGISDISFIVTSFIVLCSFSVPAGTVT